MSEGGLMRIQRVVEFVDMSKSTVYREIRDKRFPEPRKIRGCSCWVADEVRAYVKEKEQEK
jgi:predicted DNA-binding transcriptional regulator AlpA